MKEHPPFSKREIKEAYEWSIKQILLRDTAFLGVFLSLKSYQFTHRKSEQKMQIDMDTIQAKQESLSYKMNAHFLHNILSTISIRSSDNPEDIPQLIGELSDLYRYINDQQDAKSVKISEDIEFIENYYNLETTMLPNDLITKELNIRVNYPDTQIGPLLFEPFINNAFKYLSKNGDLCFIKIALIMDKPDLIHFTCENTFNENIRKFIQKPDGGKGLIYAKSRLNTLYSNKYKLSIEESDNIYKVDLTIKLS